MDKRISSIAGFSLGIISSWIVITGGYCGALVEADCPTLLPVQGWPVNSTQNYVAVTFTPQELNQINPAMTNWRAHNTQSLNCSYVTLYPSTFGTYVITSTTGYLTAHPDWGAATSRDTVSNGHITSATTTFYWGARTTTSPTINVWNQNGSPDYYRCVLTTMLHEAGHTMGLDEATGPYTAGQTVMKSRRRYE
jgi:hypothetical protein